MTNRSSEPPGDGGNDTASLPIADDISDVTQPGTGGRKRNDQKLVEKTLKFRFIQSKHDASIHPSKLHLHWIQAVQEYFGEEVIIMTNNNKVMPRVDTLTWTKEQHQNLFNLHDQENQNDRKQSHMESTYTSSKRDKSVFIVHRLRTAVSLQEMKSVPKIHELLRKHNCFLTEHRWTEDVWNTTQLGFIQGLDPQYYDLAHATSKVATELKRHFPSKTKLPKFYLAFCTPTIKYKGKDFRTKAYAIETEKSTSMEMLKILKLVYRESTDFTSFQLRNKHPEAYVRILLQQTKMISNNHVIILNNVSNDAMYYLSDRILSVEGVRDVIAVPNTDYLGKHKVLVNKEDFQRVRKTLQASINTWYESHVPDDAKQSSRIYSGIPEVAPLNSDGFSSGNGTYLSASVNTAMSYDSAVPDWTFANTTDESETTSQTNQSKQLSWAERVKGSNLNTKPFSENNSTTPTSAAITIDDELLSDLASSRAEVDDLRRKVDRLEEDKEKHRKDMEIQAAQQKRENELNAAEQKMEFERQAEIQRRNLETKLEDQRKQMEQQAAAKQQEFEQNMAQQIAQALQVHMATNLPPPPAPQTSDFTRMFENHDRQLQMLTSMISKMLPQEPTQTAPPPTSGKRSAVIDLTVDTEAMYGPINYQATMPSETSEYRKRRDRKNTPVKKQPASTSTPTSTSPTNTPERRNSSPTSSIDSTREDSQSPQSSEFQHPWHHYHHENSNYSPTIQSPMSYTNDQHPLYPGPEDDHDSLIDDDASRSRPPLTDPFESHAGILNESILSPNHLADIITQHVTQQASIETPPIQQEEPHTEMSTPSDSSSKGNKNRIAHTKPVEQITPIRHSDV
ncbi:hypothetical protein MHU86_19217 [Fragilaria crotonensis]|nr:hypothetical protein MHU86_19217 [Fragilaria crotonensis]